MQWLALGAAGRGWDGGVAGAMGGRPRVGWWVLGHHRLLSPAPTLGSTAGPVASAAISPVVSLMTFLRAFLPVLLELGGVF